MSSYAVERTPEKKVVGCQSQVMLPWAASRLVLTYCKKIRYFSYLQFGSFFVWQHEQHNVADEV